MLCLPGSTAVFTTAWIIFFQATKNDAAAAEERALSQRKRLRKLVEFFPEPAKRDYFLIGTDVTPAPRQFSKTLEDRQIVHAPNPAPGNKPIAVGHQFSCVAFLPEKEGKHHPPWAIPLCVNRVTSQETGNDTAIAQIHNLMTDKDLPFKDSLTVNVADSAYGIARFLAKQYRHDNLITVARSRANRVFFHQPDQTIRKGPGRAKSFGKPFRMKSPETWGDPNYTASETNQLRSGEEISVQIKTWNDILMRGKRHAPMHDKPFTLIQVQVFREDGSLLFKRPLWLIVHGKRRSELSPLDAWHAYRQRYDLEHFFRFGKNRLLLNSYQTPEVEHEENWWEIASLAYFQLWVAKELAQSVPTPWEKYAAPADSSVPLSPSMVQRDFERIIQQTGARLPEPKPRGKPSGRKQGESSGRRERHPPIFKGKKDKSKAA
ncbi:MAG: transposase [SAR324 cluster bacterium]|nr:transposase [SAR324 cluster bacterium]